LAITWINMQYAQLQVSPIPAFTDNYIWMIRSPVDPVQVAVVDPGDAQPVLRVLREQHLSLAAVFVTHHHPDHVGGIDELVQAHPAPVFGPAHETIPALQHPLAEGDCVALPQLGWAFQVLDVPGHTAGHIAFVGHGALFCGDTLFSGGCGRLFEGTAEQMAASLDKLARLDGDTLVYCTHEYTLSNLQFAQAVEPGNAALANYAERCRETRRQQRPTLPSTIALEHTVNPFFRCNVQTVKQAAERQSGERLDSAVAVFAAVRRWKDGFRAVT
jgi:hydroxyacylglutathione hydrolase